MDETNSLQKRVDDIEKRLIIIETAMKNPYGRHNRGYKYAVSEALVKKTTPTALIEKNLPPPDFPGEGYVGAEILNPSSPTPEVSLAKYNPLKNIPPLSLSVFPPGALGSGSMKALSKKTKVKKPKVKKPKVKKTKVKKPKNKSKKPKTKAKITKKIKLFNYSISKFI